MQAEDGSPGPRLDRQMSDDLDPSPHTQRMLPVTVTDKQTVVTLSDVATIGGGQLQGDMARTESFCLRKTNHPRLVDRGAPFRQSTGRLTIRRHGTRRGPIRRLRWMDPFHTLVNINTGAIVGLVCVAIVASWIIFAALFRAVSDSCGLEVNTFMKALFLSIETIETIGYGVPNPSFKECWSGLFVLGAASLWESLLNAVLIGLVFVRISRAQKRATSVLFSDKAVITQVDGEWYFMFQICDFRKHQLCEAHVRLYSFQHAPTSDGIHFQARNMRLQYPDDDLGGMVLLALPQLVVHRIDAWSSLAPARVRHSTGSPVTVRSTHRFPDPPQRVVDAENGNRDGQAPKSFDGTSGAELSAALLARHIRSMQLEMLCIAEGIDVSTSATTQARHSYTIDDIVFNGQFAPCVTPDPEGGCHVDFSKFHQVLRCGEQDEFVAQTIA
eukprot:TRINITY_DN2639_c0_g1_i1.p1 TRINITY_DN2639_c0_g1~~TRINITY_DN2639_c0_g1_i1.p1  ORF type:complete len:459 (+),score=132.29 TRINITY_DN2639_c0_g1_i1:52-1377(+)